MDIANDPGARRLGTLATVSPGNCGFGCSIRAVSHERRVVALEVESECTHIRRLAILVPTISLQELFQPWSRNPVFRGAEQADCHAACPVPVAIMKTVEVALGLALAQDVTITFPAPETARRKP